MRRHCQFTVKRSAMSSGCAVSQSPPLLSLNMTLQNCLAVTLGLPIRRRCRFAIITRSHIAIAENIKKLITAMTINQAGGVADSAFWTANDRNCFSEFIATQ